MSIMLVRLRRYKSGHVFAEIGAVPRTVGNLVAHGSAAWGWSSLAAQGVVYEPGDRGARLAEEAMVKALRLEGFEVSPADPVRPAVECVTCGTDGRRGCTGCGGTGRVWPDGGVKVLP